MFLFHVYRGLRRICQTISWYLTDLINKAVLSINRVSCAGGMKTRGRLRVYNAGTATVGRDLIINSGASANPAGGPGATQITVERSGRLVLGDRVRISNSVIYCRSSVLIESDVMIGAGCAIYDTDFHPVKAGDRIRDEGSLAVNKDVRIRSGAWLGARVLVLKGSDIGEGAVIGAGAVVAGNIPAGEIWAGNPARFLKKV